MLRIGLTGGIGSGKSTVADMFAARGVPVLDADQIARELVEPGQPALQAIVQRFGADILKGGALDRARLRQRVFAAPESRRWLEALLHPLVYAELQRRSDALAAPYGLWVVPLLLETGERGRVDRLLVVDCPPEVQRQRVARRDGSDAAEIERILAAQCTREQRLAAADEVIDNSGGPSQLSDQVDALHRFYSALTGTGSFLRDS